MKPLAHSSPDWRPESSPMLSPTLPFSLARCLPPRSHERERLLDTSGETQALRAMCTQWGQCQWPCGVISLDSEQNGPRNGHTLAPLWASPPLQATLSKPQI